ncbi:MAG: hypothetical protein SOR72_00080 [Hornefia sp.]|nr:hypothetical protein [Hornefia sp.]
MTEIKKHLFKIFLVLFVVYALAYTFTALKKIDAYNIHLLIAAGILGIMAGADYWLNRGAKAEFIEVPKSEVFSDEEYGKFEYKTTKDKLRSMRRERKLKRRYRSRFSRNHIMFLVVLAMMAMGVYQRMI